MTASGVEAVLCAALLLAMALWYGARMGAVPLSRRLAAMAIPLTQACALVAFAVFATRDSALDRFVPYVVFATAVCLVVDGFALPSLSLGARKESAQEQARAAAELLEATRQGAAAARREAQEADDVRRGMAQALNRAIAQCDRGEVGGAGELATGPSLARYCRNDVVDALLALKARRAGEEGVAFEAHADVPARVAIDDVDLCALFSNMLDNGINGAVKAEGRRFVRLDASVRGAMLVVRVVNSCRPRSGESSGKQGRRGRQGRQGRRIVDSHGWGLDILGALAERYNGSFESAAKGDQWVASMVVRCR